MSAFLSCLCRACMLSTTFRNRGLAIWLLHAHALRHVLYRATRLGASCVCFLPASAVLACSLQLSATGASEPGPPAVADTTTGSPESCDVLHCNSLGLRERLTSLLPRKSGKGFSRRSAASLGLSPLREAAPGQVLRAAPSHFPLRIFASISHLIGPAAHLPACLADMGRGLPTKQRSRRALASASPQIRCRTPRHSRVTWARQRHGGDALKARALTPLGMFGSAVMPRTARRASRQGRAGAHAISPVEGPERLRTQLCGSLDELPTGIR